MHTRLIRSLSTIQRVTRPALRAYPRKIGLVVSAFVILTAQSLVYLQSRYDQQSYALGSAASLLTPINQLMAKNLVFEPAQGMYSFNNGQSMPSNDTAKAGNQLISATAYTEPSKGITVTDPVSKVSFTLTPQFHLRSGAQDGNRLVYPLVNNTGWAVYTMQGTGVKEDIVLTKSKTNSAVFRYKLSLGEAFAARLESDGSIGIYGNTLFSSPISTGSEQDAALLQKARKNAKKDTLLFTIPKPLIVESSRQSSGIHASYGLDDDILSVKVQGLLDATFPVSIDPSIYVATAQQFMSGNNETNINFNVTDKLIEKGRTTGARFDSWKNTMSLSTEAWGGSTAAAGGYVYSVGGTSFSGQIYNTQGADTFTVPSGVTSITVKIWGGGGGGGAGGSAAAGGAGGGSGHVTATLAVTENEPLNIYVGGGGAAGTRNTAGGGGGGGGYSSIYRSTTPLAIAAGGGGGGGGRNTSGNTGGAGGAGGGTSGVAGSASGVAGGGGAGTSSSGGGAGSGGNNPGTAGSAYTGGPGADGRTGTGADGSGAAGGGATGGNGGSVVNTGRAGGGGGGSGRYGGGGGSGSTSSSGAGGGGGGSSYTDPAATSVTNAVGSGTAPGQQSDTLRNGAGTGGSAGATGAVGTSGANGIVVIIYGGAGTTVTKSVNWAKFNTSDGTIESTNPGGGVCSGWCTAAAYNLPYARTNFSLVAYNGFLYAIGGTDDAGTRQSTIYIAKLGANGEPRLWHPTDTNKNNWIYWYADTGLSSIRSDLGAVAYNNRMYIIGGRSTSGNPVDTVEIADIRPTGTLSSWSTSTALPTNLYGHSTQVYNDRLYVLGGATSVGGAPITNVRYIKIDSDGSLNNWVSTTGLSVARLSGGGNFAVTWGAYFYVSGGCSAVNGSGYCTTTQSDTQVASINADGSIDVWYTVGNVTSQRMAASMVAWRDRVYLIGGCSSQNTTTGDCNVSMMSSIVYGEINRDGDASTVSQSVGAGTSPCSGGTPINCNLPGTTYIGNMLAGTVITNGYLYVIGGCTNNTCSSTIGNVAYVAISSNGVMSQPATCPTGTIRGNIWCVDSTNIVTGGIAATSPVVFGGRIYLVGGLDGGGNTDLVFRTTLNTDGSFSAWQSQDMSGAGSLGAQSVSYNFAYARANPGSAGSVPGNLYIFGGCTASSSAGCTSYSQGVYKCNILTDGTIGTGSCTTGSQQQIGIVPGDTEVGLGIMSGTVYANYIYLIGGVSPNQVDLKTTRYAKFDNNNNVVSADGSGTWVQSNKLMDVGRRRAAAFGYNGYIYVLGGYDQGGGTPLADILFIKVNVSNGSLGSTSEGFNKSTVTINQRWGLSVPVSNSFAYVIGGCTSGQSPGGCSARTDVVQVFQLYNNNSGAPAGFASAATAYSTNANRIGASSTVLNGYLYVAGGCTSTYDCATAINTVSYAPINADGSLGSWSDANGSLPNVRAWGQLEAAGGSLYYIGGQSSTATDRSTDVYYATPDPDDPQPGDVNSWGTASNALPAARSKFGATVWNNRLYVLGGEGTGTGCTSNVCNTVYVSPQLNTGGNISSSWSTTSTSFTIARSGLTAVAYANNIYVFGGYDSANYLSDSQYAQISSSNGSVGSWTYTTSLPTTLSQADGFAANGYIYLVGGRTDAASCAPRMLVAPISANTVIDPSDGTSNDNLPTGIGEWYTTNQRYTGNRYGATSAYYDGKVYSMGGACTSQSAPTVSSVTTPTPETTDSTTHNATMPATVDAGDLLLVLLTIDGNPSFSSGGPSGWTSLASQANGTALQASVWAKVAAGNEDGANINFQTTTNEKAAIQTYRIPAGSWYGELTNGITVSASTSATTQNPNPASSNPANWDIENTLWIAFAGGSSYTSVTTYPTNYTNGTHNVSTGSTADTNASTSSARRTLSAASEDPGTFAMNASNPSIAYTVAVRPGLTYASGSDQVIQTTLLAQPQVAKYSIMIDTDTDVFPNYWLLNGVDNSIGAKWQLRYRSMTNTTTSCTSPAMTTWGEETLFGDVTLALPGVYTPKDGNGDTTDCARFYYFNVTVDSSQAFGYPDDVTRGPTITDLTLQFTADPSKRLMHGRTFIGGLQQPIDTPYYDY